VTRNLTRRSVLVVAVLALAAFNLTYRLGSESMTEWDESGVDRRRSRLGSARHWVMGSRAATAPAITGCSWLRRSPWPPWSQKPRCSGIQATTGRWAVRRPLLMRVAVNGSYGLYQRRSAG